MKLRSQLKTSLVIIAFASGITASAQLSPLAISSVRPNDSIVVYYDVTINNPCNCTKIGNQGSVSGSNFASLVTDDPDTGLPNDSTFTVLNMFPLPVTFYELRAVPKQGAVQITWNVASETGMLKYEVERSVNGRDFFKIGEVNSQNSSVSVTYSFLDQNLLNGVVFYRLKLIELNSLSKYSYTVRVSIADKQPSIKLYPNPVVVGKELILQLSNLAAGRYTFTLYNNLGQAVYNKYISFESGAVSMNIRLPFRIGAGLYYAKLGGEGEMFSQVVIVK